MKGVPQGARGIGVRLPRLGNNAAHLDEFMGHAAINLKVDRYAGGPQFVGIHHPFIHQRIAFGQPQPDRRNIDQVFGAKGGKTPVFPVGRTA